MRAGLQAADLESRTETPLPRPLRLMHRANIRPDRVANGLPSEHWDSVPQRERINESTNVEEWRGNRSAIGISAERIGVSIVGPSTLRRSEQA